APMLTITVYYGDDDRIDYLDFMEYYNDEEYRNGYGIARNFIYYDERGRYNEVLVEYADNGEDFEKDSKVEYVYHPSDTWTYPDVQKWLNNIGYSLILEFANSIENDAKFLTETFYGWYDDEYYPEDRTSYEYEDDKLTLAYYEWWDWDNEDWECENRGSYLYNANGLLEMYLEQFYSNHEEDWVNFERYVLTYDDISSADEHTIASPITKAVNYPNPFNPETTISFNLPKDQFVEVAVYNSKGQLIDKIISEDRSSGHNSVVWNGTDSANKPMPSGLYFYRITGENLSMKGKMLMLK
ncbi:MAG: FlgD immunoglobulin-like domain containing protein, partial [Candidatus Cloacimonas sp.]|nr:T9SS type A sorting domain-containing protein [Candidatus Cloacimonadota bacterium]